jgi:hypothetical protein
MKKASSGFHSVKLDLMPHHCRRLADGECIQLKHAMIGSGISVNVHPSTHKKLMSAHKKGKGYRLSMSPQEVEMSGGKVSWKQFQRGLKKGWDFYRKHLASALGPLAKEGLKRLSSYAGATLGTQFGTAGDKLIEELGKSGVYGDQPAPSSAPKASAPRLPAPTPAPAVVPKPTPVVKEEPKSYSVGGAGVRRRKRTTTPKHMSMSGRGMCTCGAGLYASGGEVRRMYIPSASNPMNSAVNSNLLDVGSTQYGQRFIAYPF